MRIAALDYGAKRVGVAVANTELGIPLPAGILPNDLEQIVNWLQRENIERVVVGAPYLMWGEKGERVQEIERFAESLSQRLGIPVELLDERLTTIEAERRLRESNARRAKRKQAVDAVAAALLLEIYLRRLGI
ncbi:MAG: Holliday junction resolvase RuvX [Armatimonadetes bacterium JP3_11]|jgi:putative Holliday junction resolvase|nr:MAG: Holliday junction resolvase RuvX [Armatimonadetes bacterium CP1_7O]OYT75799.1 MAG: Holliday junction resolvase RuvX [Armatimonadetes bacterium JP3_11]